MRENFVVHPDYSHLSAKLKYMLDNFSERGEYVVEGERNAIKKIYLEGEALNVKKFKNPNVFQSLVYKYVRKSKARRSFEYAAKLIGLGIKTPFPVAYLENFSGGLRQSFYVSLHIDYDFDFRELIHNPSFQKRNEILKQFTQFTFRLHNEGVNFLDHSPGNTLIVEKGKDSFDFYLIDLNRMRFEPMDLKKRMRNFRRLWLSKSMIRVMAAEYAHLYGKPFSTVHQMMTAYSRQFQKRINSKKLRQRKRRAAKVS